MLGKKVYLDGYTFDSKFEALVYKKLKEEGVNIVGIHQPFLLFDAFKYEDIKGKTHKVRESKYTPDIMVEVDGKKVAVEVKHGYITADYLMRRKLFLMKYSKEYYFIQINNEKELIEAVEVLK